MKKLVVLAIATAMCVVAQAAAFDWKYQSNKADAGSTVYVMWGAVAESFASLSDITGDALGSGVLTTAGRDTFTSGTAETGMTKAEIGSNASYYYVVVNSAQDAYFISPTQSASGFLYEGTDSSPGNSTFKNTTALTYSGKFSGGDTPVTPGDGTPEPTSGLLMLVGGALLALRRKQK